MTAQQPSSAARFVHKAALVLLSAVFSALFSGLLLLAINFTPIVPGLLLPALVFTTLTALLFFSRRSAAVTGIAAAVLLAVGAVAALTTSFGARAADFFSWFVSFAISEASGNDGYMSVGITLVCLLISLLVYLLCCRLGWYFLLAAMTGLLLAYANFRNTQPGNWLYFLLSAFLLLFFTMGAYRHGVLSGVSRKGRKEAGRAALHGGALFPLLALPFLLIVTVIAIRAPKSDLPIQWDWLDNAYNNLYESLAVMDVDSADVFSKGYQVAGGELGGPCYPNDVHVFDVSTDAPSYLKCSVQDTYTGFSWKNTQAALQPYTSAENENNAQQYELKNGSRYLAGGPLLNQVVSNGPMKVTFRSMRANYLFTPLMYSALETGTKNPKVGAGGQVKLEQKMNRGYSYSLTALQLDRSSDTLAQILRGSKRGLYRQSAPGGDAAAKKWLVARSDTIYKTYLQLPNELPDRVRGLARQIAAGAGTDYDKAKAIEQFLIENESYTLTPPRRPAGQDFVDYFLFDSNKGYCTSYATAMVVLARCLGLPARYCVGYVMPDSAEIDGSYSVTNRQAHAWPEIYFEGFGWVPFEPTPSYQNAFYNTVSASHGGQQKEEPTPQTPPPAASSAPSQASAAPSTPATPPSANESSPLSAFWLWLMTALLALGLLVAGTVYYGRARRRIAAGRLTHAAPRDAVLMLYGGMLTALRWCGLAPQVYETVFELCARLAGEDSLFADEGFAQATALFASVRYGKAQPTKEQLEELRVFEERFRAWLPRRLGKPKYVILHTLGLL